MSKINKVVVYDLPEGVPGNDDFTIRVRCSGEEWRKVSPYNVKIDMHNVRNASMIYFDFTGTVEIEVTSHAGPIHTAVIRPLSNHINHVQDGNKITFSLDQPRKLSVEVNGDRYRNLHIFAGSIETNGPDLNLPDVLCLEPGTHSAKEIISALSTVNPLTGKEPEMVYFAPGLHDIDEQGLILPSGKMVYIAGGAVVMAALKCEHVQNISIRGRGVLHQASIGRDSQHGGIKVNFSQNVQVEGITLINPPYHSINVGQSRNVSIKDFKSFSCTGWSDGIDCLSSSDVDVDDVFLRNSDDCIAIYGQRFDFIGDSQNITVRNSILWADVAHPTFIGCHGDYKNGNVLEDITFENIDILEHHEPQPEYLGCMAINAGDENIVRNVRYENIRVEQFENGRLFDLRVFMNAKYNPAPGKRIENIHFKNIIYNGDGAHPSQIIGYNENRVVDGIYFENLVINGQHVLDVESGNVIIGEFAHNVIFK